MPNSESTGSAWSHLPKPARAVAEAATEAVTAVRSADQPALDRASARLAALDSGHVGVVLGAVVRMSLEELHPDGLTADDVHALVGRCARSAAGWFPRADPDVLVMLIAGSLGVHQTGEEGFRLDGPEVAPHAALLVAGLLAASGRPLGGLLAAAFADIALRESAEMP